MIICEKRRNHETNIVWRLTEHAGKPKPSPVTTSKPSALTQIRFTLQLFAIHRTQLIGTEFIDRSKVLDEAIDKISQWTFTGVDRNRYTNRQSFKLFWTAKLKSKILQMVIKTFPQLFQFVLILRLNPDHENISIRRSCLESLKFCNLQKHFRFISNANSPQIL